MGHEPSAAATATNSGDPKSTATSHVAEPAVNAEPAGAEFGHELPGRRIRRRTLAGEWVTQEDREVRRPDQGVKGGELVGRHGTQVVGRLGREVHAAVPFQGDRRPARSRGAQAAA